MKEFRQRSCLIALLLFLLLLSSSPARADVTNTQAETATVDLETRNTGTSRNATVSSTGFVDVTANPAVYNSGLWATVDGWSVTVSPGGQIKGNTFGVLFNSDPDCCGISRSGSLFNAGAISATSATGDADGVNIGGERAVINNSGTVTARATAVAAFADVVNMSGDTNTLMNSGTMTSNVTAEDARAYGAYLMAASTNTFTNTGIITSNAREINSRALGVVAAGATNTITNSGVIFSAAPAANSGTIGMAITGLTNSFTNSGTVRSVAAEQNAEATAVLVSGTTNLIENSGSITASGAFEGRGVLVGGISNTITNTGTIAGSGAGEDAWGFGIHIDNGSFNSVTNQGTITANAPGFNSNMAIGVFFESSVNTNSLINTGVITADAAGAATSMASGAWLMGDENTLTNSGTMAATSDGYANGARLDSVTINTLTNSGTITATVPAAGQAAYGIIMTGPTNAATNSGTIAAAGPLAGSGTYGITMVGSANTLTNSGTITATGPTAASPAYGVLMDGTANTVTNSGTISGNTGIFVVGGNASIDNSGTITGVGGTAIKLANDTNTVILRTGSRINGVVHGSAGGADTMELNGAGTLSASQIVNFETLKKTGAGLWTVAAGTAPLAISNTTSIEAGTLAVGGNVTTASYSQSAGSSLGLVTTPAASATITASGTATLNNGNVLVIPAAGFYARNIDYGVVFSAGAINGTFGGVSSTSPFLVPALTAGVNSYSLSFSRDYTFSAVTPNQIAVATILNHYADAMAGSSANSELGALMLVTGSTQGQIALDQLAGLSHTAFPGLCSSSFNQYLNTLMNRLGSFTVGGPSVASSGRIMLAARSDTLSDAGNTLLTLSSLRNDRESAPRGFWMKGYGNRGRMEGDDRSSKYHYNAGGISGGFDRKIGHNVLVGLSAGYARTDASLDDLSENATVSSWQGSLYGDYLAGPWYLNGILAYGYNHNATARNITIGGVDRRAVADYAGHALAAFIEAGYVMTVKTVNVIPMASFQAGTLIRDGFTEQDAGAFNLTVDKERTSSYLSGLGIKANRNFIVKTATVTPEVRVKWLHEFSDDDYLLNAAFAGAPASTFTVRGGKPGRDTIDLGLGVTCLVQENVHLFLAYDANFAHNRLEQGGSLGLLYRW